MNCANLPSPARRRAALAALVLGALCATRAPGADALPEVGAGRIVRIADFSSRLVAPRNVDVWLPPGYPSAGRYDVLYMQDGQMLFDARGTWNHKAWNVQDAIAPLLAQERVRPLLVVGVWNNGSLRHSEYFPQKALAYLAEPGRAAFVDKALGGRPRADDYVRFLATELKPEIDRRFATDPGRDHTFIAGSSMGGIVSLYAMSEYPEVFGGAACLSTHWLGGFDENAPIPLAELAYFAQRMPDPATHRLYMDHGTEGLDGHYARYQEAYDALARVAGYAPGPHWSSRVIARASHTEEDWSRRFGEAVEFLAGPR